ncbi:hypothetical protein WJ438_00810 [Streptomyces sp. GD-15H]|uniref:hypothetical protein n=1 Tax=Streptomyces sp. GD-15H TaxID=3129112 RepID=UPI00324BE056
MKTAETPDNQRHRTAAPPHRRTAAPPHRRTGGADADQAAYPHDTPVTQHNAINPRFRRSRPA